MSCSIAFSTHAYVSIRDACVKPNTRSESFYEAHLSITNHNIMRNHHGQFTNVSITIETLPISRSNHFCVASSVEDRETTF